MADRTVKMSIGILCDILVRAVSFSFSYNFSILNCEVDFKISITLERPFLATRRVLADMDTAR